MLTRHTFIEAVSISGIQGGCGTIYAMPRISMSRRQTDAYIGQNILILDVKFSPSLLLRLDYRELRCRDARSRYLEVYLSKKANQRREVKGVSLYLLSFRDLRNRTIVVFLFLKSRNASTYLESSGYLLSICIKRVLQDAK